MGLSTELNTVLEGSTTLGIAQVFDLARSEASNLQVPGWKMDAGGSDAHELMLFITQSGLGQLGRGLLKESTRTPVSVFVGDDGMTQGPGRRKVSVGFGEHLSKECMRQILGVPIGVRGIRPYRAFLDRLLAALKSADASHDLRVHVSTD